MDGMGHDMNTVMEDGIDKSAVFIARVSGGCQSKLNCMIELRRARELNEPMVAVVVDQDDVSVWEQ